MSRRPKRLWSTGIGPRAQGAWSRVSFRATGLDARTMMYVTAYDAEDQAVTKDLFLTALASAAGGYELLCFIPETARELRLFSVGVGADSVRAEIPTIRPMRRAPASLRLLLRTPKQALAGLLRDRPWRPGLMLRDLRQLIASTNQDSHTPPQDYLTWLSLFDNWSPADFPPRHDWPSIAFLILSRQPFSEALSATLESVARQPGQVVHRVVHPDSSVSPEEAVAGLDADYIGILQAGEVLPDHAVLLAAGQLTQLGRPEIAIADEDEVTAEGFRHSPKFKPVAGHIAMLSGMLTQGLWLVRRDTFRHHAPVEAGWAEALRMGLWLNRYREDARPFSARISFLLSHRRFDTEAAPPAALASVVEEHLQHGGPAITPVATSPLTFNIHARGVEPRITVIVPSTLRQPHSLSCIQAILDGTDYPTFDLHVVVMQAGPLESAQQAASGVLSRHRNLHVHWLEAERFNFSTANNYVAGQTDSDHILLLNDDVSPIKRDWLRWMTAFMGDPEVGIVGARLLYPDGRVQHGGVIMGLAGLCDHAHRFLPATEAGYMSRAILAQEMSVVTAACMLVRRRLFDEVGGLDEGYPSAFNDVDFALRVGETGHSVIYAPQAELHHHELQTYGSHYAGERSAFQIMEVQRMRQRWAAVCAEDPFHNPNLGLVPGGEWKLAFPPRNTAEVGTTSLMAQRQER